VDIWGGESGPKRGRRNAGKLDRHWEYRESTRDDVERQWKKTAGNEYWGSFGHRSWCVDGADGRPDGACRR
jgi:hypothetical protein